MIDHPTIGAVLLAALAIWLLVGLGLLAVRLYVRLLGWRRDHEERDR